MDDMRTARSLLKSNTFLQLRKEIYDRLVPHIIKKVKRKNQYFKIQEGLWREILSNGF